MPERAGADGAPPPPSVSARSAGLRYVSDDAPGLRRVRSGGGFRYLRDDGRPVRDRQALARIRSLAIPPAWTDVWICPIAHGHLQATGRDARGRKQHRYHPRWREVRDASKYDRMVEFAKALPAIRRRVARDLSRTGLERERILATVIRLMDLTFARVGNEEYARENRSYGLTTLKNQHADVRGAKLRLHFRGKSGKTHDISVEDRRVARVVRQCLDIPGQQLFQYYDDDGGKVPVTSEDVNEYLREISGGEFTTRDFRTWAGTVLAMEALRGCAPAKTEREAKSTVRRALEEVAGRLGNTVAVCRKCYVHPAVIEGFSEGRLGSTARANGDVPELRGVRRPRRGLAAVERDVRDFLRRARRKRTNGRRR